MSAVAKAAYYRNVRMIPFDLVKELALAIGGVLIVVMILAAVFSSPDVPAVTIANWAARKAKADRFAIATDANPGQSHLGQQCLHQELTTAAGRGGLSSAWRQPR